MSAWLVAALLVSSASAEPLMPPPQPIPGWEAPPDDTPADGGDEEPTDEEIAEEVAEDAEQAAAEGEPAGPAFKPVPGGAISHGSSASAPNGTASATPGAAKEKKAAAKTRRASAGKAAAKMAESMKALTKNAGADLAAGFPGGGPGMAAGALGALGGPGGSPGGAHRSAPGGTAPVPAPSAPAAPGPPASEIASWMGPYSSLLASRGLVAERAPDGKLRFRRKDGSAATKEEVESLRQAAEREPGALAKYPDFFSAISRSDFGSLRGEYQKNPDRPTFKDVDMTRDQRQDLVWDRSCDKLSGECNAHADEKGYKKNEFVKPKAARSMWQELLELAGNGEEAPEETAKAPGRARPTVPDAILAEEERAGAVAASGSAPAAGTPAQAAAAPARSAPARAFAKIPALLGFGGEPGAKRTRAGWLIGLLVLAAIAAVRKLAG
ncbi:MAG: hypothetical protein NDJ72_06665 [Elusimicrobia bacterium]|nr:hypothetical protein [Elusimicrobiota bacterium]